ncbi:MAG: hypothetical protein ABEL51_06715 [Salinibacter sp.]
MHDIDQLMDLLGLNRNQVRVRLDHFRGLFEDSIHTGQRNKTLVGDNGIFILQRARELEKTGMTLDQIKTELERELNGDEDESNRTNGTGHAAPSELIETYDKLIASKDAEIKFLRQQVEQKDKQIHHFQEIVENRLPAGQGERPHAGSIQSGSKVGRLQRFRQFLCGE